MKEIKISEELRDKIQSIHFELNATKDLIKYLWEQSPVNKEAVDYYTEQWKNLYTEFEVAKNSLIQMYNIGSMTEWDLDYNTCILKVQEE